MENSMHVSLRHDWRLRAAASVIYDACYPNEKWPHVSFEDAQRLATNQYRRAVEAALLARPILSDQSEQLTFL
jgi:hypothetical protein